MLITQSNEQKLQQETVWRRELLRADERTRFNWDCRLQTKEGE